MENNETELNNTQQEAPVTEAPTNNEKQPSQQELNYKALREAKRKAEQERDALLAELNKYKSTESKNTSDDVVVKTQKELEELKSQWTMYQQQAAAKQIEEKLKKEFPDLEKVVNDENIETLKARDADFANLTNSEIKSPQDLYNRAISAYALIKKYGIYVEDNFDKERKKVEENLSKPRPAHTAVSGQGSAGLSDFARFSNMNKAERSRAIEEMVRERASKY